MPSLWFLRGAVAEGAGLAPLERSPRALMAALEAVDCDYLVLDLGAGIEPELLDAFAAADITLYVTVPEPRRGRGHLSLRARAVLAQALAAGGR